MDKTQWADHQIVFLGLLIDLIRQVVCIPIQKVEKAKILIEIVLGHKKKKATVLQIQRLAGYLNFLCKCVVPGRTFTMRLYSLTSGKLKPYHHIRIPCDVRQDLEMWNKFVCNPSIYCRPFVDFEEVTAEEINMYSDAAKSDKRGFGAYCDLEWMRYLWSDSSNFIEECDPSIQYPELFGVTAAVLKWIWKFKNKKVRLFCDNESAVGMD